MDGTYIVNGSMNKNIKLLFRQVPLYHKYPYNTLSIKDEYGGILYDFYILRMHTVKRFGFRHDHMDDIYLYEVNDNNYVRQQYLIEEWCEGERIENVANFKKFAEYNCMLCITKNLNNIITR